MLLRCAVDAVTVLSPHDTARPDEAAKLAEGEAGRQPMHGNDTLARNDARASEAGWLGVEIMQLAVDWQLCHNLGDGTVAVRVDPGSPARKAGIQSGDYVVSVNGVSLEEFNARRPAVGTTALLKIFRKQKGNLLFETILAKLPVSKPQRPNKATVPCGRPVPRKERYKWLAQMSGRPTLRPLEKAIATRLMTHYLNREGNAAYPSHATLARENNVCVRTVQRSLSNLQEHGLLGIISRKMEGRSNIYFPCWPDRGGKVVQLTTKGVE
jgi:hypothetical protein